MNRERLVQKTMRGYGNKLKPFGSSNNPKKAGDKVQGVSMATLVKLGLRLHFVGFSRG